MFWSHRQPSRKKTTSAKRRQPLQFRAKVEALEDRRLLAVLTVTTTIDELDGGTLANHNGPDGKLSLREAINLANLSGGPDTIVLPNGTYKITIGPAGADDNTTGDFNITDNLVIKAASGAHPVIDGGALDRVFNIPTTASLVTSLEFDGVVIKDGATAGNGGGVDNQKTTGSGVSLTFDNSTVTANHAAVGGGVFSA